MRLALDVQLRLVHITTMNSPRSTKSALRTLSLRLDVQRAELATCTTSAMRRCVWLAIADTQRQIAELLA